jgi:hypothetical protein
VLRFEPTSWARAKLLGKYFTVRGSRGVPVCYGLCQLLGLELNFSDNTLREGKLEVSLCVTVCANCLG